MLLLLIFFVCSILCLILVLFLIELNHFIGGIWSQRAILAWDPNSSPSGEEKAHLRFCIVLNYLKEVKFGVIYLRVWVLVFKNCAIYFAIFLEDVVASFLGDLAILIDLLFWGE